MPRCDECSHRRGEDEHNAVVESWRIFLIIAGSRRKARRQPLSRDRVLQAYEERCTICRLRHTPMLDAAHIIADTAPEGEPIVLRNFLFRTIAGVFFATLFVYRGFGIAAGTHALYDILVSVWY